MMHAMLQGLQSLLSLNGACAGLCIMLVFPYAFAGRMEQLARYPLISSPVMVPVMVPVGAADARLR